jgi:hypothetical protein
LLGLNGYGYLEIKAMTIAKSLGLKIRRLGDNINKHYNPYCVGLDLPFLKNSFEKKMWD